MLASIPTPSAATSSTTNSSRYFNDTSSSSWPLNEMEENLMTLATCSQINYQKKLTLVGQNNSWRSSSPSTATRRTSAAVRCHACQRKFHSLGNLANHQQLYQH